MSESEHMDNFMFHFIGHQAGNLEAAIDLATARHSSVVGWSKKDEWLVFYWHVKENDNITPFPSKLGAPSLKSFIMGWLRENCPLGNKPDIDGSVSRGYEILSDAAGWSYESFRIRPIWAHHHK